MGLVYEMREAMAFFWRYKINAGLECMCIDKLWLMAILYRENSPKWNYCSC